MKMKAFVILLIFKIVFALGLPIQEIDFDDEQWAMIPQVNGTFRLISVKDAEEEYERLPKFRAALVVGFKLYTRLNPTDGQTIVTKDSISLLESNFNPDHPSRIITHGWNNDGGSSVNTLIRDALLKKGKFNVFVVDWGSAAHTINYLSARYKVDEVGSQLANFVDFLHNYGGMPLNTLSLIGHSLGAHVSGLAAKKMKSGKVSTIVGLDPAWPLFSYNKPKARLSQDDAKYVETVQTNGGFLGFHKPIGQSSFYPNWGTKQPGCGYDPIGKCSHGRSYEYYAESILEEDGFLSLKCDNFDSFLKEKCFDQTDNVRMGGEPSNKLKPEGVYYLQTNAEQPYAMS